MNVFPVKKNTHTVYFGWLLSIGIIPATMCVTPSVFGLQSPCHQRYIAQPPFSTSIIMFLESSLLSAFLYT